MRSTMNVPNSTVFIKSKNRTRKSCFRTPIKLQPSYQIFLATRDNILNIEKYYYTRSHNTVKGGSHNGMQMQE